MTRVTLKAGHTTFFVPSPVAVDVTVTEETCSSVTILLTTDNNRTANFVIVYRSSVHTGTVKFNPNGSPPYTTKLNNLVVDTAYTITVTARYSDNTTTTVVIANTKSGTPSGKGMYYV